MAFQDLAAFIAPGFDLPIRGKTYRAEAPSAHDGLYLQAIMDTGESMAVAVAVNRAQRRAKVREPQPTVMTAANKRILSDEQERHVYRLALGPAYDEMLADGVPWPALKHAGMTAWLYWTRDEDSAERFWNRLDQEGPGKAADSPMATTESSTTDSDPTPRARQKAG